MTPQQNWVAIAGTKTGLALLAPGQYESGVLDQPDRPLCVTLFRSFRKAVFTDGNEGGQIQGSHNFNLGLAPFVSSRTRPVPTALLSQWAQNLAAPIRARYADLSDLPRKLPPRSAGKPAPRVEGDVVLSASCCYTTGWRLIRFYNPADRITTVRLIGGRGWREVDLAGNSIRRCKSRDLKIRPRKIVTLLAEV